MMLVLVDCNPDKQVHTEDNKLYWLKLLVWEDDVARKLLAWEQRW